MEQQETAERKRETDRETRAAAAREAEELNRRAREEQDYCRNILSRKIRLLMVELREGSGDCPVLRLGVYKRRRRLARPAVDVDLMALARNGLEMEPGTSIKTATTRLFAHVAAPIRDWLARSQVKQSPKGLEIDLKEWIRITSNAGDDLLVLCTNVRKASILQMRTEWDQEEVKDLLDAEGGEEAGMSSLDEYEACLQHFTQRAANAAEERHWAGWATTHEEWRDGGCQRGEQEPVCPRAPSPVRNVTETTELVVVRYEAMRHVTRTRA
jgi:hypothetical protein